MENGKKLQKRKDISSAILRSLESNYPDEVGTCLQILVDCLSLVAVPLLKSEYITKIQIHEELDRTIEHINNIYERNVDNE